jgi:hypothetical protein
VASLANDGKGSTPVMTEGAPIAVIVHEIDNDGTAVTIGRYAAS